MNTVPNSIDCKPFASGGQIAGGVHLVGERGPERIATGPVCKPYLPIYAGPSGGNDPAELVAQINAAFDQFKAANDERLKQIEKTGVAHPETVAKVDKINATIGELQKALDDQAKALGRLTAGGGGGENRDAERNARAFFRDALTSQGIAANEIRRTLAAGVDHDAYAAYLSAFDRLVASNLNVDMLPGDVRNALSVGADPSGAYVIPPERSTTFVKRMFETSPMRQIATVRTIGSDAWEQPIDAGDGISGGWVAERGSREKTGTGKIDVQRIEVHEQYAYPEITQKMLEDATLFDPAAWLEEKTADRMARDENTAYVLGDGVGKPRGFLSYGSGATAQPDKSRNWGKLQFIVTGGASGFPVVDGGDVPDCIIDTVYALKKAYRVGATWLMNRGSVAAVRKLKDKDGNYRWQPSLQVGQPSTLEGYPIEEAEDMPDIAANAFPIAFGDFRQGYTIVDRLGLTVLRDPYTNKPMVGFYIRKRTGGDVTNFDAIKLVKVSA